MTDTGTSAPAKLPAWALVILQLLGRHALTLLAGILVTKGFLSPGSEQGQFVDAGLAALVGGAGVALSAGEKLAARWRLWAAINSTPPAAPLPAPRLQLPFVQSAAAPGRPSAK